MSFFFLYKPHCFFDLGLGAHRDSSNKYKALIQKPLAETKLPKITEDKVEAVFEEALNEDDEIMPMFLMM